MWRCSCCGEGVGQARVSPPQWFWDGTKVWHHCQSADSKASAGRHPCRWFGDGDGRPLNRMHDSGTRPAGDLLAALVDERGAIVTSADCCEMEIALARAQRRFFVDETGLGYVLRTKDWLINAMQLISDHKDSDE